MVKSLKSKDYDTFSKEREVFLNEISLISSSGKEQLNSLFEILEAEERV